MNYKKLRLKIGIAEFLSAVALTGSIVTGLLTPLIASIFMLILLLTGWIILVKSHRVLPDPKIQILKDEPTFIDKSKEGALPFVPSQFLDWEKGTLSLWIEINSELMRSNSNRYIWSHASSWIGNSHYPNAFCFFHSGESQNWKILFYGDPRQEGSIEEIQNGKDTIFAKDCSSSSADKGIHLLSVRWRKKQAVAHFLIDDHIICKREKFTNWPKPAGKPVYFGGWFKGGWDSYINTKIFNVRVFDDWLTDDQIRLILRNRHEIREKFI